MDDRTKLTPRQRLGLRLVAAGRVYRDGQNAYAAGNEVTAGIRQLGDLVCLGDRRVPAFNAPIRQQSGTTEPYLRSHLRRAYELTDTGRAALDARTA